MGGKIYLRFIQYFIMRLRRTRAQRAKREAVAELPRTPDECGVAKTTDFVGVGCRGEAPTPYLVHQRSWW